MQHKNNPISPHDVPLKVDRSPLLATPALTTEALSLEATMMLSSPYKTEDPGDLIAPKEQD